MQTIIQSVPRSRGPRLTHRVVLVASIAGIAAGVYACADSTAPAAQSRDARRASGAVTTTATPGVVTICKVGPGASFDIQVGLGAVTEQAEIKEGACLTLPTITAAPGDDVIVSIRENPAPYYALDHIVFQHGNEAPQTITGPSSVSFEGTHGANVTFYNEGVVQVCKEGTDATLQYEVGLGAGFRALSLTNGQCSNIALIPYVPGDDVVVTVRENASPTYELNHITFTHGDLAPVNIVGQSGLSFEGMHGGVVVFHNEPVDPRGCTYTQGWYKNKGSRSLPAGTFYVSGSSWLTVLQTEPKGNPYYILAHQFIAASLNAGSAATTPAVDAALAAATTYFGAATPANWTAGGSYTKNQLTSWADVLGSYNEGLIGPGHCN